MTSQIEQIFRDVHVTRYNVAGGTAIAGIECYVHQLTLDVDQEEAHHDLSDLLRCGEQTFRAMVDDCEVAIELSVISRHDDGTITVQVDAE